MKIQGGVTIKVPEDVTVKVQGRKVTVSGKRGTLTRDLRHLQVNLRLEAKGRRFRCTRWFGNGVDNSIIQTAVSSVKNMINGVTRGFRYKLRFAYAHFPINVSVEKNVVEIRNFLGEKLVRRQEMPKGVKAFRTDNAVVKDELVLEGNDLDDVSQQAARIHELCLVKNKDIRMFLDGIYVQTREFCDETS